MTEFDWRSYGDGRKGRLPNDATDLEAWRRGRNRATLEKAWEVAAQDSSSQRPGLVPGADAGPGTSSRMGGGGAAVLALILILIGIGVFGHSSHSKAGDSSTPASPAAPRAAVPPARPLPKPSASIPAGVAATHPAPATAINSAPAADPAAAPAVMPTTAAAPGSASPDLAPVVLPAIHEKHFGGSCGGRLTLAATGLSFQCFSGTRGNLSLAAGEIAAVDNNGIRLVSGEKYHFTIPGKTKGEEEELFAEWLHQVRR